MTRAIRALSVLATATIALTACGGGGSDNDRSASGATTPEQSERCTADRAGGTITMGEYAMLPTFAPGQGMFGVRGAAESAAVYDRLMRWNPEASEYEPQLAESLESSDDYTVWTLKLRDGVTFSNGDPLTAEAVKASIARHQDQQINPDDNTVWTLTLRDGVNFSNGDPLTAEDVAYTIGLHQDPETRSNAMTDALQVEQTRVVDPLTVEFTLAEPWAGFPILLAGTAGQITDMLKRYKEAGMTMPMSFLTADPSAAT